MSSMDLNHIVVDSATQSVLIGWATEGQALESAGRYADKGRRVYVTTKAAKDAADKDAEQAYADAEAYVALKAKEQYNSTAHEAWKMV